MTQYLMVPTKNQLYALQNHEPGELVYCQDTNEIYVWEENDGWQLVETNNSGLNLNLYELNKSIIDQLAPMNNEEIFQKQDLIRDYYNQAHNTYHMLLCKDYNYYTVFNYHTMPHFLNFEEAICTILIELGKIYSIDLLEDGAMEIWLKPNGEETPYVFYLFPYDSGVVYYG